MRQLIRYNYYGKARYCNPNDKESLDKLDKEKVPYFLTNVIEHREWNEGDQYWRLVSKDGLHLDTFKEWIKAGKPTGELYKDFDTKKVVDKYALRNFYCTKYSFAITSPSTIAALKELLPIIEIGAGSGYWARMVTEKWELSDYYAFDNFSTHVFPEMYYNVTDVEPNPKGNETFFFCWPYMNSMAADYVKKYNPKRIVYIGEGNGGCTADEEFFELLDKHYDLAKSLDHPQYEGIHDVFELYERR